MKPVVIIADEPTTATAVLLNILRAHCELVRVESHVDLDIIDLGQIPRVAVIDPSCPPLKYCSTDALATSLIQLLRGGRLIVHSHFLRSDSRTTWQKHGAIICPKQGIRSLEIVYQLVSDVIVSRDSEDSHRVGRSASPALEGVVHVTVERLRLSAPLAEVAVLLHAGCAEKQIAEILGIPIATAHGRVRRLFDILGLATKTEVAVLMERVVMS
jgi:DNA-binding NarL/FixJ family response regulator